MSKQVNGEPVETGDFACRRWVVSCDTVGTALEEMAKFNRELAERGVPVWDMTIFDRDGVEGCVYYGEEESPEGEK